MNKLQRSQFYLAVIEGSERGTRGLLKFLGKTQIRYLNQNPSRTEANNLSQLQPPAQLQSDIFERTRVERGFDVAPNCRRGAQRFSALKQPQRHSQLPKFWVLLPSQLFRFARLDTTTFYIQ